MFRLILIAFLLFSFSFQVSAQTKAASIKKLFVLMKQDSLLDKSFEIMSKSMVDGMRSSFSREDIPLDSAYNMRFAKIMSNTMLTAKEVSRKVLNEDLVNIYDSLFTQNEIDDFIAFYKTPSGQKMINSIPAIQKEVMEIMTKKYTPLFQQNIMKGFMEITKEKSNEKNEN